MNKHYHEVSIIFNTNHFHFHQPKFTIFEPDPVSFKENHHHFVLSFSHKNHQHSYYSMNIWYFITNFLCLNMVTIIINIRKEWFIVLIIDCVVSKNIYGLHCLSRYIVISQITFSLLAVLCPYYHLYIIIMPII